MTLLHSLEEGVGSIRCVGDLKILMSARPHDHHQGWQHYALQTYFSTLQSGLPPHLLRAIEAMYTGTRAVVVTPEEFDILAGVLQDTLAPNLFIVALEYAL